MRVQIKAVGNPDLDEPRNLGLPSLWVRVGDRDSASRVCQEYIREHNLGAGNWAGGDIKDQNGNVVGYVSYNGRVWDKR